MFEFHGWAIMRVVDRNIDLLRRESVTAAIGRTKGAIARADDHLSFSTYGQWATGGSS